MSDTVERLNAALEDRYLIERELGEGGMATVYLAEDLKHERRVALKVLKPELAAVVGADRFLAEIKTTANLQHPHILPLFDSGEAEGFLYYVMPYIEGETLRDRIDREHQLPVDEALGIATAVASALHAAHEEGIVHRDIKPGNILLSRGEPLVADFGIALAVGAAGGNRLTETGLSVGTPYYMSPEQATGDQVIGPASDTYALGCVLYEMLVGDPPYVGSTAQAVLGKIIQGTLVEPRRIRPSVPTNVDAAIRKALEKLPADRFTDAREFAKALADPWFSYGEMGVDAARAGSGVWRRVGPLSAALAAVLAVVAAWGWLRSPPAGPVTRYGLAFPPGQEVVDLALASSFSVARRGRAIVYVGPSDDGSRQLWVKERSELYARPLPGTEGAQSPAISPDGSAVAFEQTGRLRLIPLRGGGAITLADTIRPDIAWSSDDELLFVDPGFVIRRVPAGGGASEVVVDLAGRGALHPNALPKGSGILFLTCSSRTCPDPELWIHDRGTGESRALVPGAIKGWFVASGHVAFVRGDGAVFALPFDPGAVEAMGPGFPVFEGVKIDAVFPDLDVAPDGTVLMMRGVGGGPGPTQEAVRVSRDGTVRPVDPAWRIQSARNPGWSLSPDGTRLAIGLTSDEGDDVWVKELPTGPLVRLTYDPSEDTRPYWSPDGDSIYFLGRRRDGINDLYVRRADGADDVRRVLEVERSLWSLTWTPDRDWLVARAGGSRGQRGQRNILAYHMGAEAVGTDTARIELLASEYDAVSPALSPDGRWLAYASEESGSWEVHVRPFPDVTSGRVPVSRGGAHSPMWSHSGDELFYISSEDSVMAASVETGASFRVQRRTALFELPPGTRTSVLHPTYDVTPDDQEFILVRAAGIEMDPDAPLMLIENWLEEIGEREGS